ncbi:protein of unknown function [Maridesulfovibrio hydrothermalis AM13 = DSM 14728]|uniref:Uncharacterized protein n=1 Tax=Maridesulfovibrio hydrothermalis AM13 = DSM 14728 TaxID=1121451 RepID=L0RI78_9BACT|nr:protein of unknown function [Maridesulfovibrio hydrothermalis AM13 = DSM 14728]
MRECKEVLCLMLDISGESNRMFSIQMRADSGSFYDIRNS